MRQSMAPNRASSTAHASSSAAASLKLIEKKKEYDAVSALERASTSYLERIEALGEDCDIMASAGEGELFTAPNLLLLMRFSPRPGPSSMAQDVSNSKPLS